MNAQAEPTTTIAPPRLLLASKSPRRRSLLAERGFAHEAESPGLDDAELEPGAVTAAQWAAALAYLKARSAFEREASRGRAGRLVLGADTVVVARGEFIGQPRDASDAEHILRTLESGEHEVVTGVALLEDGGDREVFVDRARVRVGAIGAERISAYIASGKWAGKAGAYNLAERLAEGWPIAFDGDPTTIMGLPMERLGPALRRRGIAP